MLFVDLEFQIIPTWKLLSFWKTKYKFQIRLHVKKKEEEETTTTKKKKIHQKCEKLKPKSDFDLIVPGQAYMNGIEFEKVAHTFGNSLQMVSYTSWPVKFKFK